MERAPRSNVNRGENAHSIGSNDLMPPLEETSLHVWILDLDVDRKSLALQEEMLSAEEWRKVRRYSSRRLARRFIVRRGLIRRLLGQYLNLEPLDIRFVYNAHGKPFLAPELSPDLQFNVSDSGEKAALVVGLGEPVGIDIERLRTIRDVSGLASKGSSPPGTEDAKSSAVTEHSIEFFRAWTRREALAKAEGVGLQMITGKFDFADLAEYTPPSYVAAGSLPKRGFHLHPLTLPFGYVGALATRLKTPKIAYCSS